MKTAFLAAALTAPSWALACDIPAGAAAMMGKNGDLVAYAMLDPVTLSKPFGLGVVFCDIAPSEVRVDATMPAHRHGMNYLPTVTPLAPGEFQVDGMVFHMPGLWKIEVEAETATGQQRYSFDHRLQ